MNYKCYFDGACTINPGFDIGVGGYIELDNKIIDKFGYQMKMDELSSNNVAEYLALEDIIEMLLKFVTKEDTVKIYGDSKLVIMQTNGRWKIKNGLYKEHALRVVFKYKRLQEQTNVRLKWLPRLNNEKADILSKTGI